MEILGQFVLFFVGMLVCFYILQMTSLFCRYWIASRLIENQLTQAVLSNEMLMSGNRISYDQKTIEVVEQIVIQLCNGLKYQRSWIINHAILHMSLLYSTTVWLSNDPTDETVLNAIDVIKQKFYFMHGTFINIKRSKVRNNINLFLQTTSGDSYDTTMPYDIKQHGTGCRIKIIVSVVTPLTSRKYRYLNHL